MSNWRFLWLAWWCSFPSSAFDRPIQLVSPHPESSGSFGCSIAEVPDTNGDGISEILIGAKKGDGGGIRGSGRAYVFDGSSTEVLIELISPNPQTDGGFGDSVVGCRDLNGNGGGDLIVAAWEEDGEGDLTDAGRVYVFDGATGSRIFAMVSPNEEEGGRFGYSISAIDDLDEDGVGEILVGAPNEDPILNSRKVGRVYVFGGATGTLLRTLVSPREPLVTSKAIGGIPTVYTSEFGFSVSSVRDVNADSLPEVLVGAPGENVPAGGDGRGYLFDGRSGELLTTFEEPGGIFARFGHRILGIPDITGDGKGDVLVSSSYIDGRNGTPAAKVFAIDGASGEVRIVLSSPYDEESSSFGDSLAAASDMDGDGIVDFAIGSRFEDDTENASSGKVHVFSGHDGAHLQALLSPDENSGPFGSAVSEMMDLNGDGRSELLVGAANGNAYIFPSPFIPPRIQVSAAALLFGEWNVEDGVTPWKQLTIENLGPGPLRFVREDIEIGGEDPENFLVDPEFSTNPIPPSATRDLQIAFDPEMPGEKYAELILRTNDLESRVLAISISGTATSSEVTALRSPNERLGGHFGDSVSGIPDINGDGRGEAVVGAYAEDIGEATRRGRVYVYDGATGDSIRSFTSPNLIAGEYFGASVSGVPDVNGDGRSEVAVGAYISNLASSEQGGGRAYLFDPTTGDLLQEWASPVSERVYGWCIAGIPDVNGDGFGEVAVGTSSGFSSNQNGRVYLYDGANGALLHTFESLDEIDFGTSVSGLPDVNGNGAADVLVGAPGGESSPGKAYVFDGLTGELVHSLASPHPQRGGFGIAGGRFGWSVSGMPDATGDAVSDIVVGARWENTFPGGPYRAGHVHLFNGTTGEHVRTVISPAQVELGHFGYSVSGIEDVNGDEFGDFIVGANQEGPLVSDDYPNASGTSQGRAHIFDGSTGELLQTFVSPNAQLVGTLGNAVSSIPDTDGDGIDDVLAGAEREGLEYGDYVGRAYIFNSPYSSPDVSVFPEELDFGTRGIDEGPSSPQSVTISNVGENVLRIEEIAFPFRSGVSQTTAFSISESPLPGPVPQGESREVKIVFDPNTVGSHGRGLRIRTNDPDERDTEVIVRGRATDFTPTPTPVPTSAPTPCDSGYYVLDSMGGRHRVGNPIDVVGPVYFGMDIARDLERAVCDVEGATHEDLVVLDGYGLAHFVEGQTCSVAQDFYFGDMATALAFPQGRAVDLQMTADSAGFWVLSDFGEIYRAGSALVGDSASEVGVGQLGVLGFDVPTPRNAGTQSLTPIGTSLRAVSFVALDEDGDSHADGYIVLDSMGGRFHYLPDGSPVPAGTSAGVVGNEPQRLLDPNGYLWPFFPGLDIARDMELHPAQGGVVIFDGWGGIHPVPVDNRNNPVWFARNEDPIGGGPAQAVGMPYLVLGFDDPTTGPDESVSLEYGLDAASIFTDLEFSAGCPDSGLYTLDKFGGVFALGSTRANETEPVPGFGNSPYFYPFLYAADMEVFAGDETEFAGEDETGFSIELVNVPAGTFMMGRRDDGDDGTYGDSYGGFDELPRHPVTLSAYQIGKYEVTNAQYSDVLNWANGMGYLNYSSNEPYNGGDLFANGQLLLVITATNSQISYKNGVFVSESRQGHSLADHPVSDLTWYGTVAFCNWLSEKEGRTPCYSLTNNSWNLTNRLGGGYRLPSESEWERAAAWDGSKHWIYGFHSDTLIGKNRCNYNDHNPNYVNPLGLSTLPYTSPVGWFNGKNISPNGNIQTVNSPSPVGCYDMSGNEWEWCEDWYHTSYVDAPLDGSAWLVRQGNYSYRVFRGGDWANSASTSRTAERLIGSPADRHTLLGFRIARTPQ